MNDRVILVICLNKGIKMSQMSNVVSVDDLVKEKSVSEFYKVEIGKVNGCIIGFVLLGLMCYGLVWYKNMIEGHMYVPLMVIGGIYIVLAGCFGLLKSLYVSCIHTATLYSAYRVSNAYIDEKMLYGMVKKEELTFVNFIKKLVTSFLWPNTHI